MLKFLWVAAPPHLRYVLLALAVLAGFTRDYVMLVVSKAAAAPLNEAMSYWLLLFVVAFITVLLSAFYYQILSTVCTTYVVNNVRLRLINNLFNVQPAFIDRYQHGSLYHILTTDVGAVTDFTKTVLGLLPSIVFLLIAIPQLFSYSIVAGLFSVLVMVGGTLAYHLQQKGMSSLNVDARQLDVDYFEGIAEMLRGFRELRLHEGRQVGFTAHLGATLAKLRKALIAISRIYETGETAVHGLKFLLFGGIVFIVPYFFVTDTTTTFTILTLVLFCLTPFEQVVSSYPAVIGTLVAFHRIEELDLSLAPFAKKALANGGVVPPFKSISLHNLTAAHTARESSAFVLGPLNFTLQAGEIVFLVGDNGSGKTTFLNVLAGLHTPNSGEISVDAVVVPSEAMGQYRGRISTVFTHYHVFRYLYGLEDKSAEEISTTLEKVHLAQVTGVQDGKITRLDLSAGQKRRLALAIALLENRDILMLDEFVADQDPSQREYFFKTLLPSLKASGKTVVVSTHDLQWIECCDRVLRFDKGQMTESNPAKQAVPSLVARP